MFSLITSVVSVRALGSAVGVGAGATEDELRELVALALQALDVDAAGDDRVEVADEVADDAGQRRGEAVEDAGR